jgi:hypothetical protein
MSALSIQKEILVVTSSKVLTEELSKIRVRKSDLAEDSFQEELEEACWNGLLDEMLPIIIHSGKRDLQLFLWEIFIGEKTVCAELSKGPFIHDSFHSVNPYVFLNYCHYS